MEAAFGWYFEKFFTLEKFMRQNLWTRNSSKECLRDCEFAWSLMKNTGKCIVIMHFILFGHHFSQGKRFYLTYLKASLKAVAIGFGYSVYFNDEKLEVYLAKNRISIIGI